MKRFFLILALVAVIAPTLFAQQQTEARRWLKLKPDAKADMLFGFCMGADAVLRWQEAELNAITASAHLRPPAAPVAVSTPAPDGKTMASIIASLDKFYRLPKNANFPLADAIFMLIRGEDEIMSMAKK